MPAIWNKFKLATLLFMLVVVDVSVVTLDTSALLVTLDTSAEVTTLLIAVCNALSFVAKESVNNVFVADNACLSAYPAPSATHVPLPPLPPFVPPGKESPPAPHVPCASSRVKVPLLITNAESI
jgi:hypothetical protein